MNPANMKNVVITMKIIKESDSDGDGDGVNGGCWRDDDGDNSCTERLSGPRPASVYSEFIEYVWRV